MANVKIIRNVAFIESGATLATLKSLAKHRPDALVLKDKDKNELYKLASNVIYNFVKNTKATLLRTPETERYVVSV